MFDVIVIGSGPGGYVAAIRAAQLGLKAAIVEKWERDGKQVLGGTCLNVGCIPAKSLLESSHLYHLAKHEFATHGIGCPELGLDVPAMIERKQAIVKKLNQGVAGLMKANKVEVLYGAGSIEGNNSVGVTNPEGEKTLHETKNIIIATGSVPVELPFLPFKDNVVVDSAGAMEFQSVPGSVAIVGAGVIGLEMGSVWSRLGSAVTIYEAFETFLPTADKQIADAAQKLFSKQGMKIHLGAKVKGYSLQAENALELEVEMAGKIEKQHFDKLVVAVGRKPFTEGLLGEKAPQLAMDDKGFFTVNQHCQTNQPNIFAIGDVAGQPMLAHKASEEGVMAAEIIAGHKAEINYETIPNIIYTSPQVSWVGKTEEQLKDEGVDYKLGSFPMAAIGRALANNTPDGLLKVISHAQTDRILGVHMLGEKSDEMLTQATLAMEFEGSTEDLQLTMFPHPTMSESLHEAALAVDKRAIHAVNKK